MILKFHGFQEIWPLWVDYNAIRVEECNQHFFLNYVKKYIQRLD